MDGDEYKRHGSAVHKTDGWPLVALVNPRSFGDPSDTIEVEAGAKKGAIRSALKKMLKTKQSSKVVLTQLVENFSWATNHYHHPWSYKFLQLHNEVVNPEANRGLLFEDRKTKGWDYKKR